METETETIDGIDRISLWPEGFGGLNPALRESVEGDRGAKDRSILGVRNPCVLPMLPERPNGLGVLVCPGGGYERLVIDKEGFEIARWLNASGVSAFVLISRLPNEGYPDRRLVPLADAQRAMRIVKAKFGFVEKLGVIGFSAGGHLAASLGTRFDERAYAPADASDRTAARPDFMILGYPVISFRGKSAHPGSRDNLLGDSSGDEGARIEASCETRVRADTPPGFIFHAADDGTVPAENSLAFFNALRQRGVKGSELHVFREGGHGFGLRGGCSAAKTWPMLCGEWLESIRRPSDAAVE